MRTCIWRYIILVIWASKCLLPVFTSDPKTKESYADINTVGTVTNESQLPNCNGTERINLISYEYRTRDSGSTDMHHCNLSYIDKISIHRSCSFKQACGNISLPISDSDHRHKNLTYMLYIRYQCSDSASFTWLCSKIKETTNSTLHLILNDTATLFKGCECSVDGSFTLNLTDVRLNEKKSELCSPAVINLQVFTSSTLYLCNNESHSYFQYVFGMKQRMTIAFETNSSKELPEMVWLTLKPNISTSLTIDCTYVPSTDPKTISLTYPVPTSSSISADNSEENSSSVAESSATAGLSVFGVLATIVAIIYVLLKCRRKKRPVFSLPLKARPWMFSPPLFTGRSDSQNVQSDLETLKHSRTDSGSASTGNTTDYTYTQIDPESYLEDPQFQEKRVYAKTVKRRSTKTDPAAEEEQYDVIAVNKRIPAVTQNYNHVVLGSNLCIPDNEVKPIGPSTGK